MSWAGRVARKVWETIWSLEGFYALFLFAATLKRQPLFSSIPIDLTVVGAAVLLVGFSVRVARGAVKVSMPGLEAIGVSGLLTAYLLLSTIWAPLPNTAKMVGTVLVWASFVVGVLLFSTDPLAIRRFSNVMALFGLYAVFVVIKGASLGASYALKTAYLQQAGSYLTLGSVLAFATLVCAHRFFRGERLIGMPSFVYLAPFGATLVALALNNSRQSLIGGLLGLAILVAVHRPRLRFGRLSLSPAWIQALIGIVILSPLLAQRMDSVDFRAVERLQTLLSGAEGRANVSANERVRHWGQVMAHWDRHPMEGHGIGAYGAQLSLSGQVNDHPHNIWMELLYEGGLIAVTLAGAILILLLRGLSLAALFSVESTYLTAILVSFAVAASVSGSYGDTRGNMMAVSLLTLPILSRRTIRTPQHALTVPVSG
ncbi:MAG: O-antigen ligase family protein [Fimbriimonadaceae bacterium]|nr:O-antigen ligase family protein [Fimbriimonadaceae bacterium]